MVVALNTLLYCHGQCSKVHLAQVVWNFMYRRKMVDIVSYNSMYQLLVDHRYPDEAVALFDNMRAVSRGEKVDEDAPLVPPDAQTWPDVKTQNFSEVASHVDFS